MPNILFLLKKDDPDAFSDFVKNEILPLDPFVAGVARCHNLGVPVRSHGSRRGRALA